MSFGIRYKTGKDGEKHSINGERYVYYQRLFTDNIVFASGMTSRELGERAKSLLNWRISEGSNAEKLAEYFFNLRNGEYKKEVALLKTKFGQSISGKYDSPNSDNQTIGRELIEAFNTTLNMKSVFERNLAIIQQTKGQKGLIATFPTYFTHAWSAHTQDIINKLEESNQIFDSLRTAVEEAINFYLPTIVREALIEMFRDAKTEAGVKNGEKYQQAYAELLPALLDCTNQRGNEFIDSFIKTYKLNELVENLQVENEELQTINSKVRSFNYKGRLTARTMGILGGGAAENLSVYITDIMQAVDPNYRGHHTGDTGQKADAIFTFDIPIDVVENWLNENSFGHREKNVAALQRLENQLEQFDEGFIIYSNAKNYTLNSSFDGFSAGKAISLDTWDTLTHIVRTKGRDLIFSALQLVRGKNGFDGAIGENERENVSMMFARAISLALFDDFDTVGVTPRNGVKSIHLLYLNGIYFPLSFYFNLLGEAFKEYAINEKTNINSLIRVDIKSPEMLYPEMKDQPAGVKAWNEQSHNALENTKISYHFMRAYSKIMKDLFK